MPGTVFIRFLRLQLISIFASLPILLIEKGITESVTPVLILSFLIFVIAVLWDTGAFSKAYWKRTDIAVGIFAPYCLYLIFGMTSLLWMPSTIYNYLFLALRAPEIVFHQSLYAVISSYVFMLAAISVVSVVSSLSGKRLYEATVDEDFE